MIVHFKPASHYMAHSSDELLRDIVKSTNEAKASSTYDQKVIETAVGSLLNAMDDISPITAEYMEQLQCLNLFGPSFLSSIHQMIANRFKQGHQEDFENLCNWYRRYIHKISLKPKIPINIEDQYAQIIKLCTQGLLDDVSLIDRFAKGLPITPSVAGMAIGRGYSADKAVAALWLDKGFMFGMMHTIHDASYKNELDGFAASNRISQYNRATDVNEYLYLAQRLAVDYKDTSRSMDLLHQVFRSPRAACSNLNVAIVMGILLRLQGEGITPEQGRQLDDDIMHAVTQLKQIDELNPKVIYDVPPSILMKMGTTTSFGFDTLPRDSAVLLDEIGATKTARHAHLLCQDRIQTFEELQAIIAQTGALNKDELLQLYHSSMCDVSSDPYTAALSNPCPFLAYIHDNDLDIDLRAFNLMYMRSLEQIAQCTEVDSKLADTWLNKAIPQVWNIRREDIYDQLIKVAGEGRIKNLSLYKIDRLGVDFGL